MPLYTPGSHWLTTDGCQDGCLRLRVASITRSFVSGLVSVLLFARLPVGNFLTCPLTELVITSSSGDVQFRVSVTYSVCLGLSFCFLLTLWLYSLAYVCMPVWVFITWSACLGSIWLLNQGLPTDVFFEGWDSAIAGHRYFRGVGSVYSTFGFRCRGLSC